MKDIFYSFFIALSIFLIIDIIWLSISVKLLYKPAIGSLLNQNPILWSASLFYFIYIFCLTAVIIKPALVSGSLNQAFWMGLLFGMAAYSTYNLTNMSVLKNWSVNIVFVDIIWGSLLTAFSSLATVYLIKNFFHKLNLIISKNYIKQNFF